MEEIDAPDNMPFAYDPKKEYQLYPAHKPLWQWVQILKVQDSGLSPSLNIISKAHPQNPKPFKSLYRHVVSREIFLQ